jgi:hypothetical protein
MVSSSNKQAIIATLVYSDIFNFPLTRQEIWKFLLTKNTLSPEIFDKTLRSLSSQITQRNGYFCIKGREEIIDKRIQNQNEVEQKRKIAKQVASYLSYIPSIQCIGISGGVAVGNAQKKDDIDFFIITQRGTLWITRLWVLAICEVLGVRRKRGEKTAPDKICCNLFIEETQLTWPTRKRNIYTAHEIAQLQPLFVRENTYQNFLQANTWVYTYLPNTIPQTTILPSHRKYFTLQRIFTFSQSRFIQKLSRTLQKKHMQNYQTTETVTDEFLAFHPHDYAAATISLFHKRMKKYGLLTNI